ncbi:MAG: hypothetical protein NUV63_09670 [Gallionella sp.]|nr:hypothetical protein [Gallionella sp.]
MRTEIPKMTYEERQARAQAKKDTILGFMASGEVYTSVVVAAQVMAASPSAAERTLISLVRDGALKRESHMVESRKTNIYGITPHGLALMDQFDRPYFQLGRTNSAYISHHLETQRARLAAEEAGWADWTPGKLLHSQGLKKIPDAIATSPAGARVAIEIERHIKTPKRYEEVISAHLQSISKKLWREVHYLTPVGLAMRVAKAFANIKSVPVNGDRIQLEQAHRDRFRFYELHAWPAKR